jgi:AcrR family transcriptional regulator
MIDSSLNLKDKIVCAARTLFATKGVEHVSMRKVAECIGYSPTTIYLYFKDKNELLNYLVQEYYNLLITKSMPVLQRVPDNPLKALRDYLVLFVELGLKNQDYYQLMVSLFNKPSRNEDAKKQGLKVYSDLMGMVSACMDTGDIPRTSPEQVVQSLWAVLFGLTSLLTSHPKFDWQDKSKLLEFTIDTHLTGLRLLGS